MFVLEGTDIRRLSTRDVLEAAMPSSEIESLIAEEHDEPDETAEPDEEDLRALRRLVQV